MISVLLRRYTEYDYIAAVNEGKLPFNARQDTVHGMLECAGCRVRCGAHTAYI